MTSDHSGGHLIPLPGTEWTIWRDALLRTAGFPAAGLDRFAAPGCAAVADAFLDGRATEQDLRAAHEAALADASKTAADIAVYPLFQEALTWQNPAARPVLGLAAATGQPPENETRRGRQKRRFREDTVARYWQRYCGKNDTKLFAKLSTEIKPLYLDLTSPRYLSAFATMLRTAKQKAGGDVEIVFTEMLPDAEDAWVPGPGRAALLQRAAYPVA